MATEIIAVGGKIDFEPEKPLGAYSTYTENRSLNDIEEELAVNNFPFSFRETLKRLKDVFPHEQTLRIFEGGCGYGFSLGGLKALGKELGISIETTGATNAQRNLDSLVAMETDILYFGDIRSGHARGVFPKSTYHFVLDYYGALRHDQRKAENGWWHEGGNVLSIYGDIVAPGGILLAVLNELDEQAWKSTLPTRAEMITNGAKKLIQSQGFSILRNSGKYALLQKNYRV